VMTVRNVPWWPGLIGCSAVLMVSGWAIATSLQPRSFDPAADTVSALAALGAGRPLGDAADFLAVVVWCRNCVMYP